MTENISLILCLFLFTTTTLAQRQYADTLYNPVIENPEYPEGKGSVIYIDEGHHNFHTKDGRYKPFATLLARDGYQIRSFIGKFNREKLESVDILVISNALHETNTGNWNKPNPSAFTKEEIAVLNRWVRNGGSLFLIADHMPMAGAAKELVKSFGYRFYNGFATDSTKTGSDLFTRADGTLISSSITNGRNANERIDSIRSFTGQAFEIPKEATPILAAWENWVSYQTEVAWQIDETTPILDASNWYQGAFQTYDKGKLVVFGEAAMFSAQIAEVNDRSFKAGMNRANAKYNHQLLLNIIHWLDENP